MPCAEHASRRVTVLVNARELVRAGVRDTLHETGRIQNCTPPPPVYPRPMKKNLLSIVALVFVGLALTPACGKEKKKEPAKAEPAKPDPAANAAPAAADPAAADPAADKKDPKAGSAAVPNAAPAAADPAADKKDPKAGSAAGGW